MREIDVLVLTKDRRFIECQVQHFRPDEDGCSAFVVPETEVPKIEGNQIQDIYARIEDVATLTGR